MNGYRINKFLFHLSQREEHQLLFLQGDANLFDDYDLEPEEREAILQCSVTRLHQEGVHPLLLMHLSLIHRMDIRELYRQGI
ncbi:hypothetical protein P9314_10705 [Paenibacillus validus]|uniref:Extradiol ring-cleavage dioxygenase LigAB LigA subunit domain-containing protein n=1 Tax=Paenibacillus validus TaxID=44253 RepID=A0A7X2ZDB0_9BACL|nr:MULTISPECIES: hypothetical protein [Paenibacillus]MED4601173.1 hypothetical protein [Paenibacillus validus]MED4606859.1 hypothetical protein [Paenibacillus validus]MUG72739.1 hypothetical protein [Paenibacillus validus]